VERITWSALAILIVLGLFGLFANGPSTETAAAYKDGTIAVEFQRFAHKTALSRFTIRVKPASPQGTRLRLGPAFFDYYDIELLEPRPLHSSAGAAGLDLTFAASDAGDLAVHLAARAKRFGIAAIAIDVEGQSGVSFTQLIYP
jgi:hypothetical protein